MTPETPLPYNFATQEALLREIFANCQDQEAVYDQIMALGKELNQGTIESGKFPESLKNKQTLVPGCQSKAYLSSDLIGSVLHFKGTADALISAGLIQLLLIAYNDAPPEEVIKSNISFLQDLKITDSLSPGRANGLASMHLHMKKEALKALMRSQNS